MEADLDMNSNDILNVGRVSIGSLVIGGTPVVPGDTVTPVTYDTDVKYHYKTVAGLVADTQTYTYFSTGDYVLAEGFTYIVAASGATDHHVINAGSVKFYVTAPNGTISFKAFDPDYQFHFRSKDKPSGGGTIIYKYKEDLGGFKFRKEGLELDFYSDEGFIYLPTENNKTKEEWQFKELPELKEMPSTIEALVRTFKSKLLVTERKDNAPKKSISNRLAPMLEVFVKKKLYDPMLFKILTPYSMVSFLKFIRSELQCQGISFSTAIIPKVFLARIKQLFIALYPFLIILLLYLIFLPFVLIV